MDTLSDAARAFGVAFIASHHTVTVHTPLADVVVGCSCTPGVQRNGTEWAEHLLALILAQEDTTSDASAPPAASVDDRPAPDEEAGAGRVIPFPTK